MLIVFTKVKDGNLNNDNEFRWDAVAVFQNDQELDAPHGDDRLRTYGPGTLRVFKFDPENDTPHREVVIGPPRRASLTDVSD